MKLTRRLPRIPLLSFSLCAFSFSFGFFFYILTETLYKTFFSDSPTHWSMGLVAGLAFLFLLFLDRYSLPLPVLCLAGGLFITAFELLAGFILNLHLSFHIWDYSDQPLNLKGQICPLFSLLWCVASLGIVFVNRFFLRLFSHFFQND